MEGKKIITKYSDTIIYILFFVGALAHPIQYLQKYMIMLTPFTLFITTSIVIMNLLTDDNKKIFLWLLIVFFITMLIEIIGVHTKIIFGNYQYGNTLGIKIFGVPIIIGFNWVLIILGAIQLSNKLFNKKLLILLVAPVFTVLFDFILEPVAIKLDYWSWHNNTIPIQNYIAWYIISLVAVMFFSFMKIELKNNISMKYFIVQLIFFLILKIFL
ncbi:MAG: carotenoid biosynthesis protein [Melioribacteraceae bacterium]|nr:carotenoid biosynthesis protein [Melioribacteraceae bacterium]